MVKDLQDNAKAYEAQRQEIETFAGGKDAAGLAEKMAVISGAVKAIRSDVSKHFVRYDNNWQAKTNTPENIIDSSINHIVDAARNSRGDVTTRNGNLVNAGLQAIISSEGKALRPEHDLDKIAQSIATLAKDEHRLGSYASGDLASMDLILTQTADLLKKSLEHEAGNINTVTAVQARKALQLIERDLLPALEQMQPKMVAFNNDYITRHGDDQYLQMLKAAPAPERSYGKGALKAAALAGAIAGGVAVEGGHRAVDYVRGRGDANVRTMDPAAEKAKADAAQNNYRKAILDGEHKSNEPNGR